MIEKEEEKVKCLELEKVETPEYQKCIFPKTSKLKETLLSNFNLAGA
jgi:hypothetical protein